MTLFNQLDERDKLTLADYIRSQTATPRKPATKKKKEVPPLTLLPDDGNKEPICKICGNEAGYTDHFQPSPNYHPFESPAKSAGGRSSRKGSGTKSAASSEGGAGSALAASSAGD
jgi:hypothetical protein